MRRILLAVGGVFQLFFSAVHVGMFFGIAAVAGLSPAARTTAYLFNAAVLTTVLFFAFVSFAHWRDLLATRLGRTVAGFIVLFYLQRGLVELFISGLNPVILGLCLVVALLYAATVFTAPGRRHQASVADEERVPASIA